MRIVPPNASYILTLRMRFYYYALACINVYLYRICVHITQRLMTVTENNKIIIILVYYIICNIKFPPRKRVRIGILIID